MNKDEREVLVVDYEELAAVIVEFLDRVGLKARAVSNGQDAIDIFRKNKEKFSLIIMDIDKYKSSGAETLLIFQEINPKVKVILIGASFEADVVNPLLGEKNCIGFFVKPFPMSEFSEKVRKEL